MQWRIKLLVRMPVSIRTSVQYEKSDLQNFSVIVNGDLNVFADRNPPEYWVKRVCVYLCICICNLVRIFNFICYSISTIFQFSFFNSHKFVCERLTHRATCLQAYEVSVMLDRTVVFSWFFARSTSKSGTLVHRRILQQQVGNYYYYYYHNLHCTLFVTNPADWLPYQ